ncbi:MAG: DegT/DnrJ/EryC1/StrS family aminotransferase [Candidatus Omnitrophica bacterium]|nr:DegT/DnrJ/EryC1/StrS family aminotransferase [Candidatus Omnitrophota bacterium]
MPIFREIPPTAGFPIHPEDFLSLLRRKHGADCLEQEFREYHAAAYAGVATSGTAAFYLILEALKEISGRKTVIIPSYICPLIPLAIKRAGLNIEICDINRQDFNFNRQDLERIFSVNTDILAVLAVHLAGIPLGIDYLVSLARGKGVFVIEDCAQSLGAVYKGKKAGTWGDFAFFSLCRGKGLTIYEGGIVIASRKDYGAIVEKKIRALLKNSYLAEGLRILELFGYAVFYRPLLFWFVFRLPQLFWHWQGDDARAMIEYFDIDFPLYGVSSLRKAMGHAAFWRLEDAISLQRKQAAYYLSRLAGIEGVKVIAGPTEGKAVYPYLTLLFADPKKQEKARCLFKGLGLGVSVIYLSSITDYGYLKPILPQKILPNARYLAERAITLPTGEFLREKEQERIIDIIKNILRPGQI